MYDASSQWQARGWGRRGDLNSPRGPALICGLRRSLTRPSRRSEASLVTQSVSPAGRPRRGRWREAPGSGRGEERRLRSSFPWLCGAAGFPAHLLTAPGFETTKTWGTSSLEESVFWNFWNVFDFFYVLELATLALECSVKKIPVTYS